MTLEALRSILSGIRFNTWEFRACRASSTLMWMQVRFTAPDNVSNELNKSWSGRKWIVSKHATEAEVVQTALKAVLTALEHEAREQFFYNGVAIFQPHIDLKAMAEAATHSSFREKALASVINRAFARRSGDTTDWHPGPTRLIDRKSVDYGEQ